MQVSEPQQTVLRPESVCEKAKGKEGGLEFDWPRGTQEGREKEKRTLVHTH